MVESLPKRLAKLLQMAVGKVEELFPVIGGDGVFPGAEMIADVVADGPIGFRLFTQSDAFEAEQPIVGFGMTG